MSEQQKLATKLFRTIRLPEQEIDTLLDRMDKEPPSPGSRLRQARRYPYRVSIAVHFSQQGGAQTVSYLVPTRNLSEGGLSFLLGKFVYTNTPLIVQLTTPYGSWHNVGSRVRQCRYLEKNVHEVKIQFDHPIDPASYCTAATGARVLLADDDHLVARIVRYHLEQMNVNVDHVEDGEGAVNLATEKNYDIILMDMEMPGTTGFEAVETLRQQGYTGKIVAATAMTRQEDQVRCMSAGCDMFLPKPYGGEHLADLLRNLREEPVYSEFMENPGLAGLVNEFVSALPEKIRTIQEEIYGDNIEALAKHLRSLKGEGASFGFSVITEQAGAAEEKINHGAGIEELRNDILELARLCFRVRSCPQ